MYDAYIKTETGVDFIFGSKRIQNAKRVVCGSKTIQASSVNSTGIKLFTTAEFREAVGDSNAAPVSAVVLICRDFREGWSHHMQTCTYQNGDWYVVLSGAAGNTNAKHINYMIISY
jgi:hypothetical protein